MTMRKKIIIGLIGLAILVAVGFLIWGIKTGKIKPRADTTSISQLNYIGQFGSFISPQFVEDIAVDSNNGNVFVLSSNSSTKQRLVDVFDKDGKYLYQFNVTRGIPIPAGCIYKIGHSSTHIAINSLGSVYIANGFTCSQYSDGSLMEIYPFITIFNNGGTYISSINISRDGSYLAGIVLNSNNALVVLTGISQQILVYSDTNQKIGTFSLSSFGKSEMFSINQLDNNLYIYDYALKRIAIYNSSGQYIGPSIAIDDTTGLGIEDLTNDSLGKLYISNARLKNIKIYDRSLNYLTQFGLANSQDEPGKMAVTKDGATAYVDYSSTTGSSIKIFGSIKNYLKGNVKGQDSDSENQIPMELAKVKTTINGKTYFARTDKDGKYTLDFSDQTTLPTTPITVTATSDDSYDSQDQQVTVTLNQTSTKDFVLNRTTNSQIVSGLSDINDAALAEINFPQKTENSSLVPIAHASDAWTLRGRILDINNSTNAIPGVEVRLYPFNSQNYQQTTTDQNGAFTITTPITGVDQKFTLVVWKTNEVLYKWQDWSPGDYSSVCPSPLINTDCWNILAAKVGDSGKIGKIRFNFYGADAMNWKDYNAMAKMATMVQNIKANFRLDIPREIAIVTGSIRGGWTVSGKGMPTAIFINAKDLSSLEKALTITAHETSHQVYYHRFSLNKQILEHALRANKNTCINIEVLDINCSFTPLTESTYIPDKNFGHPWDNISELFASSYDININFLFAGGKRLIFLQRPGFINWMQRTDYSQDKKNANQFVLKIIESRRQQINGEKPHLSIWGLPLDLSKTYSAADILAGKYP